MLTSLKEQILKATHAIDIVYSEAIAPMWSGYGEILKVGLKGATVSSVIVKAMSLPDEVNHPRGWNNDLSNTRKLKSYQVEWHWYQHYVNNSSQAFKIPRYIWQYESETQKVLIMEDLTECYPLCPDEIDIAQVKLILQWLARFHAEYLFNDGEGLWPMGTYWHLETRPDELSVMNNIPLKTASSQINDLLNNAQFQTLVHGDAKLANFCFSEIGDQVAGVDFQYVGRGCGMKDVIYFFSSCLSEQQCFKKAEGLLGYYFIQLEDALVKQGLGVDFSALEKEWRTLYSVAWADFHRFIDGWSPNHWKVNKYMETQTNSLLNSWLNK